MPTPSWHNRIVVAPVTSSDQQRQALMIRGLSFFDGERINIRTIVDGNDFQATLFIATIDDEPIGSARVRWFKDFAKFERSCLLPKYRDPRAIAAIARQVFDHVAMKGYDQVITYAKPEFARMWSRLLGFEINHLKAESRLAISDEPYFELIKRLPASSDRITADSPMGLLERIEGFWHERVEYEIAS